MSFRSIWVCDALSGDEITSESQYLVRRYADIELIDRVFHVRLTYLRTGPRADARKTLALILTIRPRVVWSFETIPYRDRAWSIPVSSAFFFHYRRVPGPMPVWEFWFPS